MRRTPLIIAGLLIFLSVFRVEAYAQHSMGASSVLAWLFAIAIAAGVYVSSYFTKYDGKGLAKATKAIARSAKHSGRVRISIGAIIASKATVSLLCFLVVDGVLNVAEAYRTMPAESGLFVNIVVGAYGAAPTLLAAVMGWLQGSIDRLPRHRSSTTWLGRTINFVMSVRSSLGELRGLVHRERAVVGRYHCKCGWVSITSDNPRSEGAQWAAHSRRCKVRELVYDS